MKEVEVFSKKLHTYGTIGALIVQDSALTLQFAQVRHTLASLPTAGSNVGGDKQSPTSSTLVASGDLTREQILQIIAETVRVQGIVQQEVSVLARQIAKKLSKEKTNGKKKKYGLTFVDGHKKIQELGLPREPLEDHGLTENDFQKILLQYEEDEEVMASALKLLHPVGKGDPERAKGITMSRIVEIHQFMVTEMQKVLQEFLQLPCDVRRSFTSKGCETTAELLVSIAVEQQLSVHCEDVEQAVIRYEEALQGHPEFTRCTEQLANMMQLLIGASQPRVEKEQFLKLLRHMAKSTRAAKAFAKKLYEDYRGKVCGVVVAYRRFEQFSEEQKPPEEDGVPDLSSVELQLCYEEYRNDDDVRQSWEQSGAESSMLMQAAVGGTKSAAVSHGSADEKQKNKKQPKSSEVVEMQQLMVDELKRTSDAIALAVREGAASEGTAWRPEIVVQLVQALASAAVERRYGTSAEEMTMAGFHHAATLQKNERFVHATQKQQEILMSVASLFSQDSAGASS